ncbi:Protein lunapark-like Protein [Tribolium castaneum]|uniref:Endoplasmic reticulum junction formation protein lunapark n=4 Tax=Tenebrionoidea TaxID=71527 RepID=D6WRW1_TRICA|nr:Protein lunapark-like Protein [Tribolium castaneum]
MGIIITKFRKKKTTYEVLEKLEKEIQSIEEFRRSTEQTQKKMVGRFIFISICVYCVTALILYFYFFPASAYERIIYIIPLIILPMLLILIKRTLSWYYSRKIRKNQKKLSTLKEEKKKILEEVMDKETYKVAKTILEKFAPEQVIKRNPAFDNQSTPVKSGPLVTLTPTNQSHSGLRYRGQLSTAAPNRTLGSTMTPISRQALVPLTTPSLLSRPSQGGRPSIPSTPLPLPRAILPRERTVLDKMVDYLVGDGPSNRFALICKNCAAHNGMAIKEEFEYLSFRCCYCLTFNPSRKKRPIAPKLDNTLSIKDKRSAISDSDSDSDTAEPIITEPLTEHNVTESEKLSDYDVKNSDTESTAMEVNTVTPSKEKSKNEEVEDDATETQD